MSTAEPGLQNRSIVHEVETRANAEAVNTALAGRGVDATQVISILLVAGTTMAGGTGDRYRVLYRD